MKTFVNLAALTLLIPTAHAGLILEPIAFPGGLNSSWTATVPGMPFFIGTGALRPEPTAYAGTITLSPDDSEVTYSGIGWTMPAATDSFDLDILQIDLSVDEIHVSIDHDITLPVTMNFGNTIKTPGFSPTEFTTVSELEIAWSITGPTSQVSGVSRWPMNTTAPVELATTINVQRDGSQLIGPIVAADTRLTVIWGEMRMEVFNGVVDGIPVVLSATTIHANQFYRSIPEPAAFGLLAIGCCAVVIRRAQSR